MRGTVRNALTRGIQKRTQFSVEFLSRFTGSPLPCKVRHAVNIGIFEAIQIDYYHIEY